MNPTPKPKLVSRIYGNIGEIPRVSAEHREVLRRHLNPVRVTVEQAEQAKRIKKSLGLNVAARYLRRRGWSFEAAHYILLGKEPRHD